LESHLNFNFFTEKLSEMKTNPVIKGISTVSTAESDNINEGRLKSKI